MTQIEIEKLAEAIARHLRLHLKDLLRDQKDFFKFDLKDAIDSALSQTATSFEAIADQIRHLNKERQK